MRGWVGLDGRRSSALLLHIMHVVLAAYGRYGLTGDSRWRGFSARVAPMLLQHSAQVTGRWEVDFDEVGLVMQLYCCSS